MDVNIDNDKLITAVKMQTALWDRTDPNYSDKIKKDNAWKKVFNCIFRDEKHEDWDEDKTYEAEKALQKRWKHLRNSFSREVAKRKRQKNGPGKSWKTYIYYGKMSFLIPSLNHTPVDSNIDGEEDAEETGELPEYFVPVEEPPKQCTSRVASSKRKREAEGANSLADVLIKHLKWKQEKDPDNDPDRLFILSLLNDFKRVPEENKAEVKIGLIRVISNGMYSQQRRGKRQSSSSSRLTVKYPSVARPKSLSSISGSSEISYSE